MRPFARWLFALAAILCLFSTGAKPYWQSRLQVSVGSVAAPSYVFIGNTSSTASGGNISQAFNLGANATCQVVVGATGQKTTITTFSVTVGGVSLAQDDIQFSTGAGYSATLFSAALPSCSGSQTVALTTNVTTFSFRSLAVWVLSNVASTTKIQSGGYVENTGTKTPASPTIAVVAGDLLFIQGNSSISTPGNCSGSSAPPSGVRTVTGAEVSADWLIAATNASFVLNCDGVNNSTAVAAATYK